MFDEDGHEGDDPVQDVLCDDLAEGGLGVALDKGVFEDFLADGDLVIVPTKGVLDGEPTDDGLGVVLDEEVLVDFLAEGDLVDVPADDVLEANSWLDVHVCGLRVVLRGDQAGVLPVFTSERA